MARDSKCSRCGETKDQAQCFGTSNRTRSGFDTYCLDCRALLSKNRRRAWSPEQRRAKYARNAVYTYTTPRHRFRKLLEGVRQRVAKHRLRFDIDLEWLETLYERQHRCCAVTGIVLRFEVAKKKHQRNPYAPSIDQIIPGNGYTKDNVRLVCYWANQALGQWGDDTAAEIATQFLAYRAEQTKHGSSVPGHAEVATE